MKKIDWELILVIFFIALVLTIVGIQVYIWIVYGNKPIQETPNWVNWIMYRGNK